MTTNTELIADLQSNIVGDPFPLMRKAADAIEALESEIQRQYACIRSHAEITHKAEDERDARSNEAYDACWHCCRSNLCSYDHAITLRHATVRKGTAMKIILDKE